MGLLELTTNLKSLKYEGPNKPLITKDINDPPKTGGISMQVNHRIDDLVRHTKLLVKKPGLKFLGNQALLAQTDMKKFVKEQKKKSLKAIANAVGQRALNTLENTALATASVLAQIPVNGTGTHFVRGFKRASGTYLGVHGMKVASFNAPDGSIITNNDANGPAGGGKFKGKNEQQVTGIGNINKNRYTNGDKWIKDAGEFVKTAPSYYMDIEGNATENAKIGNKAYSDNDGTSPGKENIVKGSKLTKKETPLSNLDKPGNKLQSADQFVDGTGTKNQDISYIGTKEDGTIEGSADKDYRLYQDNKVALGVKVPKFSRVRVKVRQVKLN